MKLLKQINKNASQRVALSEDAAGGATGANNVAGGGMPLFASLVKRTKPTTMSQEAKAADTDQSDREYIAAKQAKKKALGLKEAYTALQEFTDSAGMGAGQSDSQRSQQKFDTTEVMSKLKGLENKEKTDHRDTVSFGLEDDNGGIVRVIVKNEQAQDFEKALQAFMGDHEREEDESPEIAEILFKLKDRFDIVDVQWPEIAEDEEQDQGLAPQEGDPNAQPDPNADPNAELDPNADPNADPSAAPEADTGDVESLLSQVIDMMKADAEARTADARARQAEAKVKEADAIAAQAMARVKQEEQYLDMDTYNKSKKEESKEAKRLAQLAKWKHDMGKDGGQGVESDNADSDLDNQASMGMGEPSAQPAPMQGVEQEERSGLSRAGADRKQVPHKGGMIRGRVHPHDVASFILSRVKP